LNDQLSKRDLFKTFTISDYFIIKSLIFAQKTLKEDVFGLYSRLFHIINKSILKPDLLVYLYLDTDRLQNNIKLRGRDYEQNIPNHYLDSIQSVYINYIKQQQHMRILLLDINKVDFVKNKEDYQRILHLIDKKYDVGIHRIVV
jgi:deoxyguanosine kinase